MAEKEYIERQAVIKIITQIICDTKVRHKGRAINRNIKQLPTADVQEVRHGSWKPCFDDWRKQIEGDECSACGFQHYGTNIRNYNYCPNCGAKMDKE